ncbi:MAG: PD40 domain-containing protein [Planctomycetes bacterium]|nr:PD40 domain-containing protein [Planctomycetota bacterium]
MSYLRPLQAILLGAFAASGCVHHTAHGPAPVQVNPTWAVLAASNARQINMFGDLPDGTVPSFHARATVSLQRHTFSEVGRDFDPDLDAQGRRIVFASTRHHVRPALYMKRHNGVTVTQLTSDPASDVQPMFSPDGTKIAFASDRAGSWDIWVMDLTGGPPVQVTTRDADEVHPSWSPDGTQLVFCSLSVLSGQWELWLADATRRAGKRFIGFGLFPEWSPVEDTIVFQRAREQGDRRFSIWTISLVDGEPGYPTEIASSGQNALILPSWSPDGRQLTYTSSAVLTSSRSNGMGTDNGPFDIWVVNADGTGNVRLTDGATRNFGPTFGPGSRVFFASDRTGFENIWSLVSAGAGSDFPFDDSLSADGAEKNGSQTLVKVRTASDKDGL